MGRVPDEWVKEWLAERRTEGPEFVKGWTIEKMVGFTTSSGGLLIGTRNRRSTVRDSR